MLKKLVIYMLSAVGLLNFSANFSLAERATNFTVSQTLYPSLF